MVSLRTLVVKMTFDTASSVLFLSFCFVYFEKRIIFAEMKLNNKTMATITLNYNTRNTQAKNLLNYVLSTGLLTPKIENKSGLEKALEDLENGRVYHAVRRKVSE